MSFCEPDADMDSWQSQACSWLLTHHSLGQKLVQREQNEIHDVEKTCGLL